MESVTKWALKEAGVIRVVDVKHHKVGRANSFWEKLAVCGRS